MGNFNKRDLTMQCTTSVDKMTSQVTFEVLSVSNSLKKMYNYGHLQDDNCASTRKSRMWRSERTVPSQGTELMEVTVEVLTPDT